MNYIYIVILLTIVTVYISYNIFVTIKKIKLKRQTGKDIRHKNGYYSFVTYMFLKNLPK
jgi:glutamate formiminotransferase